jgi:multiple sugar transport system ATP-binding protein
VLNAGVLQQVGTPEEVYDRPVNRFVASFIGSPRMNFLSCVLCTDGAPELVGQGGTWRLRIPEPIRDTIRERLTGDNLVLGVRPEDIALNNQPAADLIETSVYTVEPLGDRTIFDLRVGEEMVKARTPPTFDADMGSKLWMRIDTARIHLFDPQTDQAII